MLVRFTKSYLETLTLPAKGRAYFHDDKEQGLSAYITASGMISFYTRKRVNGRDVRMVIGNYPDTSIEQARKKSQELKGLVAVGKDPHEEKKRIKSANQTFGELFEEYLNRYSKKHKKSWKYDEREVSKFLSHWLNRRIDGITKSEIQLLHEKIFDKNGLYQANRILERVRAIYNKAIEWGWQGTNPTIGIKKFKEKSRDRFVQPFEMPHLVRSINEEENEAMKDFFWLLLLTGARKTNTLMMRWEEISWDRNEWRIPDTKNGEPLRVALVSRAVEILKRRKIKTNSPWVFHQEDDEGSHLVNPKRAWSRTLARATLFLWEEDEQAGDWVKKIELDSYFTSPEARLQKCIQYAKKSTKQVPPSLTDIRIHDLRRTFGSYQALSGASLQIIGKSLGHKSQQSTQVYARLNLDPVRAAIEKATEIMLAQ